MSQIDDLRDEYIAAVSNLFGAVSRNAAFQNDPALKAAAMAAQVASGGVEKFSLLELGTLAPADEKGIATELQSAEVELARAVETFLGKTISMADKEISAAARALADAKTRFDSHRS
jgi:hypothetical protein